MPEGPECRVIAEGLNRILQGKTIISARILGGRYARHGAPEGFVDFVARIPAGCTRVAAKGKFIYFEMADGRFIWNTLGMSGCWSTIDDGYARLKFVLYPNNELYFLDVRNFGTLHFGKSALETSKKLKSLGIDMLNSPEPAESSIKMLSRERNLKRTLVEVLMDQKCYAGVGNYVKAEALYKACLSPHRIISSLSRDEIHKLHGAIGDVLQGSYAAKGVTLSDYRDVDGNIGVFKRVVYGQVIDPLGNPVVREETLDGRTTHWVPNYQK